jgi:hypothetical protein
VEGEEEQLRHQEVVVEGVLKPILEPFLKLVGVEEDLGSILLLWQLLVFTFFEL